MSREIIGKVVGFPTAHSVSTMGNAAKQVVIMSGPGITRPGKMDPDGYMHTGDVDAQVLVTAANASIGYTIGNAEYRDEVHVFTLNHHGKITSARKLTDR